MYIHFLRWTFKKLPQKNKCKNPNNYYSRWCVCVCWKQTNIKGFLLKICLAKVFVISTKSIFFITTWKYPAWRHSPARLVSLWHELKMKRCKLSATWRGIQLVITWLVDWTDCCNTAKKKKDFKKKRKKKRNVNVCKSILNKHDSYIPFSNCTFKVLFLSLPSRWLTDWNMRAWLPSVQSESANTHEEGNIFCSSFTNRQRSDFLFQSPVNHRDVFFWSAVPRTPKNVQ